MDKKAVNVFYCYSRRDSDLRDELSRHLSVLRHEGMILDWHDKDIEAGDLWDDRIKQQLDNSDLLLLLVSANFLASEYCYGIEMTKAIQKHKTQKTTVIPIFLKPIDWDATPFANLKPLPRKPITMWRNHDKAFASVAKSLRKTVKKIYLAKQSGSNSTFLDKVKSYYLKNKPPLSPPGANSKESYLRVQIECPSCAQIHYVTCQYAGAKYCCHACGCIETVPHELQLFGIAVAQEKIPREVLAQLIMRKLEKQDVDFTISLLQKELVSVECAKDDISESDIIKHYVPSGQDLTNLISVARQAGIVSHFEDLLEEATANIGQPITEEANKVTDALIDLANQDEAKRKPINENISDIDQTTETESDKSGIFSFYRVLCCYCEKDVAIGRCMADHLETLKQAGVVSEVGVAVLDSKKYEESLFQNIIASYHVVIFMCSTDILKTVFAQQNGIDELLMRHENSDLLLIPILARPMAWRKMKLSKIQLLPANGHPLSEWPSLEEGCANVIEGIQEAIDNLPIKIIVKTAESGDAQVMFKLALAYLIGKRVSKNEEKALYWWKKAAETGKDPFVMWGLAITIQNRDPKEALHWMSESADAGHIEALVSLGEWYDNGTCVAQDLEQGFALCLKAVEAGKDNLLVVLAGKYMEGIGTSKNLEIANQWLQRGADKKIPMALLHLGYSYYYGRGVDKDLEAANQLLKQAWASGDPEVMESLKSQGFKFWEGEV